MGLIRNGDVFSRFSKVLEENVDQMDNLKIN